MDSKAKSIFTATLLLLSGSILVVALLSMMLELLSMPAQTLRKTASADELTSTLNYLQKFPALRPVIYSQQKSLEGELWLRLSALSKPADPAVVGRAISAFREALKDEPVNANLWAKLALCKSMLNQRDEEFYDALHKAFDYGGWEYEPNYIIVGIGMANLDVMNTESLFIVRESVRRMYKLQRKTVIDFAKAYGQLHVVCLWIQDIPPVRWFCLPELQ